MPQEKDNEQAKREREKAEKARQYKHETNHPDNKEPVTRVAESSDEQVKKYEDQVNAAYEKDSKPEWAELPGGKPADAQGNPTESDEDKEDAQLENKTVPELREMAAERDVEVSSDMRKDELVKALRKGSKKG